MLKRRLLSANAACGSATKIVTKTRIVANAHYEQKKLFREDPYLFLLGPSLSLQHLAHRPPIFIFHEGLLLSKHYCFLEPCNFTELIGRCDIAGLPIHELIGRYGMLHDADGACPVALERALSI